MKVSRHSVCERCCVSPKVWSWQATNSAGRLCWSRRLPFVFRAEWLYFTPVGTFCFPFKEGMLLVRLLLFGEWLLDYDQTPIFDPYVQISWFCGLVRKWDWILRIQFSESTVAESFPVAPPLLRPSHRHALTFFWKNVLLKVYSIEKTDRIGTPAT